MPTTGVRPEDQLIDLFLTVYEERAWAGPLSMKASPERTIDSGVEMLATRVNDGRKLAIEHTLIEPFVGEKTDFHNHFKELAQRLKADESLQVPGFALYVYAPLNILPRRANWQDIIDDVAGWLRANRMSFPSDWVLRDCPSSHHPQGKITLQVRLQPLDDPDATFLIVQRYGEMRVGDAVEKALLRKLPKLVKTDVHARLLLLERDQAWVAPDTICDEVERLRPQFPTLSAVHEIWIVDTASFDDKKEYVEFSRREGGCALESFAFFRGKLLSIAKHGMPVHVDSSALH
jgi:hypothetical protein